MVYPTLIVPRDPARFQKFPAGNYTRDHIQGSDVLGLLRESVICSPYPLSIYLAGWC